MKLNRFLLSLIVLASGICENYVSSKSNNVEEAELKRVAALLQSPMYAKAQILFNEINNVTFIEPIMEEMYPNPTFEVVSMASFIDMLKTMPRRIQAYQKWEFLVRENGQLLSPWIIVLKKRLDQDIIQTSPSPPKELTDMKARTDMYAEAVVVKWVNEIVKDNISYLIDFGSPRSLSIVGHAFTDEIETLIEKLLKVSEAELKFEEKLDFVLKLRWDIHKLIGLITLNKFESIKAEQLIKIGAHLFNLMTNLNGPDSSKDVEQRFKIMWNNIDPLIKQIFWHKSCTLKTMGTGGTDEYMTVTGNVTDENGIVRNIAAVPPGSDFKLEHRYDGATISFNIVSLVGTEKYLDLHTKNLMYAAMYRMVTLRKNPTNYQWFLEVAGWTSSELSVKIFHGAINHYLGGRLFGSAVDTDVVLFELSDPTNPWTLKCTIDDPK